MALNTDLQVVLLGKTGEGKSASANTILGAKAFQECSGFQSVSGTCKKLDGEVDRRRITLIDTPGLFDTRKTADDLKKALEKCVELSVPGPHVFLLVIRLDARFTEEEKNAVKWVQKNFGERASQFTMVLFTHADRLDGITLEEAVKHEEIREIIDQCGGGYHALNNRNRDNPMQVSELLGKIDVMVERNRGEYYTNMMYQETQRKINDEEKRKREEVQRNMESERKQREEEKRKIEEAERQAQDWKKKAEEAEKKLEDKNKKIAAAVGGGLVGAAGGAVAGGAIGGPVGAAVGAAVGAPIGVAGGLIGAACGETVREVADNGLHAAKGYANLAKKMLHHHSSHPHSH